MTVRSACVSQSDGRVEAKPEGRKRVRAQSSHNLALAPERAAAPAAPDTAPARATPPPAPQPAAPALTLAPAAIQQPAPVAQPLQQTLFQQQLFPQQQPQQPGLSFPSPPAQASSFGSPFVAPSVSTSAAVPVAGMPFQQGGSTFLPVTNGTYPAASGSMLLVSQPGQPMYYIQPMQAQFAQQQLPQFQAMQQQQQPIPTLWAAPTKAPAAPLQFPVSPAHMMQLHQGGSAYGAGGVQAQAVQQVPAAAGKEQAQDELVDELMGLLVH